MFAPELENSTGNDEMMHGILAHCHIFAVAGLIFILDTLSFSTVLKPHPIIFPNQDDLWGSVYVPGPAGAIVLEELDVFLPQISSHHCCFLLGIGVMTAGKCWLRSALH